MTDRAIAVGDLVQVVRWDCCGKGALGYVFKVRLFDASQRFVCSQCNQRHLHTLAVDEWTPNGISAPVEWCKRIPPLSELEGTKTDEPMKEPA